jgi:hypothetical protein
MRDRALAEVGVQLAELKRESRLSVNEQVIQRLQCQQTEGDIASTIGRLQAERASLVAQLQSQADEAALSRFDVAEQENLREQSQLELGRLQLALEGLDVETAKVRQDKANLVGMRDALHNQRKQVSNYSQQVDELKRGFNEKQALRDDLQDKIEKKTLQLTDQQKEFILSVIEERQVVALEEIAALREELVRIEGAQQLEAELLAIERQLSEASVASREKIMDMTVKAPTSNAEAIFWDFENLQAELSRGAPEFIDRKRRLLENINFTYNLYRNRYNMLTRFASDVPPIDADKTFVRNSGEVQGLLGHCGSLGPGSVCQPGSLTWSKDTMTASIAEFTVDKNSGLVQRLLSEGHAQFEISPFARSQADSRNLGSFVLWDPAAMNDAQSMTLVQAVIGLQGSACQAQHLTLRHLGTGATYARLSKDNEEVVRSLVVHRPVQGVLPAYGDTESALLGQEYSKFREGSYTAEGLEEKLHETSRVYPFVGYPLVATYELVADDNLAACLSEGAATLKLGFIFVRK